MKDAYVIVVGGGWAGLAAATRLVQNGAGVLLVERGRELGGRASSFFDRASGEWLDNGPHLFIGAYTAALELLDAWGSSGGIDFESGAEIPWIYPGGRIIRLKLGAAGGKFGALKELMTFRGMSISERLKSVRVAEALVNWPDVDLTAETTVAEFLAEHGIRAGDCGGLWDSLTTAVMNAPPSVAGLRPLVRAVKEGLLAGGEAGRLGLPIKPFKQLYIDPAREYLAGNGVDIRLSAGVDSIQVDSSGAVTGVQTGGQRIPVARVILAVPPCDLLRMLPRKWKRSEFFARFDSFAYSTITAVHLVFERPVLPVRFGFLPGAFTHWLFGRGWSEPEGWSRLSALISHAPGREEMLVETIGGQVLEDLRERLPVARHTAAKSMRVVRNTKATPVLKPGSDDLRPPPRTPIRGLYLAGDWCATGLPATIESAARSGMEAARALLAEAG